MKRSYHPKVRFEEDLGLGLLTHYLNEVSEHHAVSKILTQITHGLQTRLLPQLSVHPGHVRHQLLLKTQCSFTRHTSRSACIMLH